MNWKNLNQFQKFIDVHSLVSTTSNRTRQARARDYKYIVFILHGMEVIWGLWPNDIQQQQCLKITGNSKWMDGRWMATESGVKNMNDRKSMSRRDRKMVENGMSMIFPYSIWQDNGDAEMKGTHRKNKNCL